MHSGRGFVVGVVGIVLLTTVASAPFVGVVDPNSESEGVAEQPVFGDGNVTVSNVSLPDRGTLERSQFDAGEYIFTVPAATMDLERVRGNPRLVYIVDIDALGYRRSSTYGISSRTEGHFSASMERDVLEPDQITNSTYDAHISLERWSDGSERVIAARNITVAVVE